MAENELKKIRCPACGTFLMDIEQGKLQVVCRRCKARISVVSTAEETTVTMAPKAK